MQLLGRVAKNVGGVAKGVGGAMFKDAKTALTATADDESEVELQLQRISDALMPEYRREATGQLKDLLMDNPKAQLAVGNMGIPVLVRVLQDDRDDLELIKGALECLVSAMSTSAYVQNNPSQFTNQESQAGAINAELFARKPEHVQLLLNLLEEEPVGINDFYVRYHTVQLLTVLLQACAYKLQDAILSSPMGVVRLCDMLAESEIIRNEALQLLVALTRANEEVQKIAAFEGAFDRVFNIVREEGGADGGVVVQDCLELLNNLLRTNQANQRLFREMGFIPQLVRVFSSAVTSATDSAEPADTSATAGGESGGLPNPAGALSAAAAAASAAVSHGLRLPGAPHVNISKQKASILLCALESVMLLVAPASSASAGPGAAASEGGAAAAGGPARPELANKAAMLQAGIVEALLPLFLTLGGVSSQAVRIQALHALGDVISSYLPGQDKLSSSSVAVVPPAPTQPSLLARPPATITTQPALQALLNVCLHAADAPERAAAQHLLHAYCAGNPDGQLALVCSMAPGSVQGSGAGAAPGAAASSFGEDLVTALVTSSGGTAALQVSCRAACILQHLVVGNPTCKQRLLTLPLALPNSVGTPAELLLPRCMKHITSALRVGGEAGEAAAGQLLKLLVVWLHDCPAAVKALLDTASHLPVLVDMVTARHTEGNSPASGLAALLLGECLLYGPASSQQQPAGPGSSSSNSDLVLDVVLTRIGFGQFFARLDELVNCPEFVAASQAPQLPKPVTRATAAAATANEEEAGSEAGDAPPHRVPGAAASIDQLFDPAFAQLIKEVSAAVGQAAMQAFSKPAGTSTTPGLVSGSVNDAIASLPGSTDVQKLMAAVQALRKAEADAADMRARNKALAEDLFRVTQGGQPVGKHSQGGASDGGAARQPPGQQYSLASGASSAADVESRVAAEMRASKAEMELAALKQQMEVMAGRLMQADRDAAAAREAAASAHLTATKHETDLQDLSTAYNSLEGHAFQLEKQVRELSARVSSQPAGGVTEQQVEARVRAAVDAAVAAARHEVDGLRAALQTAEARAAAVAASAGGAAGGVPEAEVERRVQEAVEEAQADSEEQLTDLLVCLGQEEQKVALLRERLEGYGVDVDAILATIKPDNADEEDIM